MITELRTTFRSSDAESSEDDALHDREIRRGMAMDDRIRGSEPTISLNGFARRHPSEP
jgi:hypothetical protein